jgi:hypothetical protein
MHIFSKRNLDSEFRRPAFVALSIGLFVLALLCLILLDEALLQRHSVEIEPEVELSQYVANTDKSYEAYKQWTLDQTVRAFDWHARSTKIIFWISMLVGISGICFSFWQFVEASREERRAINADEIELKMQFISLAFKSRSIAALMMFVSLAYLLIYVTLVYPVRYRPQEVTDSIGAAHYSDVGTKTAIEKK